MNSCRENEPGSRKCVSQRVSVTCRFVLRESLTKDFVAIPLTAIEQTKASAPTNHEVAGYMPGRLEFEHEVDNDAEVVIKDMEFGLVYAYGGDEQPEAPTKGDKPAVINDKPITSSKALPSSTKPTEGEKGKPGSGDGETKDVSGVDDKEEGKEKEPDVKPEAEESDGEQENEAVLQPGMHVEDEEDLELKLAALEIYYEKLAHRQQVKDFIFDRALMDYKRVRDSVNHIYRYRGLTGSAHSLNRCRKRRKINPKRKKILYSDIKFSPKPRQPRISRSCLTGYTVSLSLKSVLR